MGSPGPALGRRDGFHRGLDRRAPHRPVGAASVAGPAGRTGPDADEDHPAGTGRLPAALPPPGGTREPPRPARPPPRRPADILLCRDWPSARLAALPRRPPLTPPTPKH